MITAGGAGPRARRGAWWKRAAIGTMAGLLGLVSGACADHTYATNRVNPVGPGAVDRSASIDILGARIVSDSHNEGRLIGALVNNTADPARLESIHGVQKPITARFDSVSIPAGGHTNLAESQSIRVTGRFSAGEVVELAYVFDTGERVALNVPVAKRCDYYTNVPLPKDEESDENTSGDTYLCTEGLLEEWSQQ